MQYYILVDGQQVGPMNKEELLNYNLSATSMVWCENLPEWMQASNVPDLADLLQGNSAPVGEWFVLINGQQNGPYTAVDVKNMRLSPDTMVWKNGMHDWNQVSRVPEFCTLYSGHAQRQAQAAAAAAAQQQAYQQQAYQQQAYQQPQPMMQPVYGGVPIKSKNLPLAIIATVVGICSCFGLILGIIAIVKVNSANSNYASGNEVKALSDDNMAKTLSLVSLGLTALFFIIAIFNDLYYFL